MNQTRRWWQLTGIFVIALASGAGCADVEEPGHGQRVRGPVYAKDDSARDDQDDLWPDDETTSPEANQAADSTSQTAESDSTATTHGSSTAWDSAEADTAAQDQDQDST
jgi:hypothetical protein